MPINVEDGEMEATQAATICQQGRVESAEMMVGRRPRMSPSSDGRKEGEGVMRGGFLGRPVRPWFVLHGWHLALPGVSDG